LRLGATAPETTEHRQAVTAQGYAERSREALAQYERK
jgi:hypothetical protein